MEECPMAFSIFSTVSLKKRIRTMLQTKKRRGSRVESLKESDTFWPEWQEQPRVAGATGSTVAGKTSNFQRVSRSRTMRSRDCPLDLAIRWSLVDLARKESVGRWMGGLMNELGGGRGHEKRHPSKCLW